MKGFHIHIIKVKYDRTPEKLIINIIPDDILVSFNS